MTSIWLIKAVSGTVFDIINAVYHDKHLIFIKTVPDTVFDMINAVYHNKHLIFIKAVSGTVFDMINAVYHDKHLIFILFDISQHTHLHALRNDPVERTLTFSRAHLLLVLQTCVVPAQCSEIYAKHH